MVDAFHKVTELDREFQILNDEVRQHSSAELVAKRDALDAQRPKIYEDAISELRSALGEDAFNRLNRLLYQMAEGAGTIKVVSNGDSH